VGLANARKSLEGLSVGDAFGERFFAPPEVARALIEARAMPAPPWRWTDDTAMALSIVDVLEAHALVDEEALAAAFARRYMREPARGYGGGAHAILQAIARGEPWREVAGAAFDGQGSMGNGAAMRSAPIGAFFGDDLDSVVLNARRSAAPTHAHAEGEAGAIAVAVAAALAPKLAGRELLHAVADHVPASATREGIVRAGTLAPDTEPMAAAEALGNGSLVLSQDTVPFALFAAAHHVYEYEEALWYTVAGLGDRDTTCAIVGGIVALRAEIPAELTESREPLGS
jgi:ADP-ribosylglycohydrolase